LVSLNNYIENEIKVILKASKYSDIYREPLVGFGDASNPLFKSLKDVISEDHLLPEDFLSGAKSVVSFFLPFKEDLIKINKNHSYVSREWAVAYVETNKLINVIIQELRQKLASLGINASDNPAKLGYDHEKLISRWSQRHIAYVCGLGTFGINNMLVTKEGCGGRYGSFVIDKELEFTKTIEEEYCLWKKDKTCGFCIKACPVGALTEDGFDRYKCHKRCTEVNNYYNDLEECDSCGKCLTGICSYRKP
jgi:epoxyqueuosine reductase